MGIDNRARRAAKRRKRAQSRGGSGAGGHRWKDEPTSWFGPAPGARDDRAVVAAVLAEALAAPPSDGSAPHRCAVLLLAPDSAIPVGVVTAAASQLVRSLLVAVLRAGWTPTDLAEITRRRLTVGHLPALASWLDAEAARHPRARTSPAWLAQLASLGAPAPADLASVGGLERAIALAALLSRLPSIARVLPPPGARPAGCEQAEPTDARLLARVRALLAKAESTEYAEEAEALSGKAQELISRHSLDRMLTGQPHDEPTEIAARRLWIDAPYVMAKALLVDAVAGANRCRTVSSVELGFSTVVGEPRDMEAVELLATSLLVQADAAMLTHGRHSDRRGTSRTTSFRRSFLVSYATRIGERLRAATAQASTATGHAGELVPLLRRHDERVASAQRAMFPRVVERETRVSNGLGWAAGRAAADLALLGTDLQVTRQAG